MKKIIFYLFTFIVLILAVCLAYFSLNREEQIEVYALKEAKSIIYTQNEEQCIDLYSNKDNLLIEYPEDNTYNLYFSKDIKITLLNVSFDKSKLNDYYLYSLKYIFPSISLNDCFYDVILEIINIKYTLSINIGIIKIINENYNLLSFNKLYGSYSYINNELMLVGINIEIADSFKAITKFSIANTAFARFDICKNTLYSTEIVINEIIPNFNISRVINTIYTKGDSTIFIPLGYLNNYFIRRGVIEVTIDEANYIIDVPSLIMNKLDITSYDSFKIKGELNYAKA